jgi:protein-L-isoaspartate(D-aspartate) O-methyltransferase
MQASGRETTISERSFDAIQARKPAAMRRIEAYLKSRFNGEADPAVLRAFETLPREYFHWNYQGNANGAANAYETEAKPWGIGYGSALSDYLGQAYMTQACAPKPEHVVLEIGTGSGYQSALLSRIVARQYSIEIINPLGTAVQRIFAPLGYGNVETRVGDGFFGWPEVQGGFDTIIVTCAAQYVPPALLQQIKPGGRLVIPIGQPFRRGQFLYIYTKDEDGRVRSRKDVGVYFIPMTGTMMNRPRPQGGPARPATAAEPAG